MAILVKMDLRYGMKNIYESFFSIYRGEEGEIKRWRTDERGRGGPLSECLFSIFQNFILLK